MTTIYLISAHPLAAIDFADAELRMISASGSIISAAELNVEAAGPDLARAAQVLNLIDEQEARMAEYRAAEARGVAEAMFPNFAVTYDFANEVIMELARELFGDGYNPSGCEDCCGCDTETVFSKDLSLEQFIDSLLGDLDDRTELEVVVDEIADDMERCVDEGIELQGYEIIIEEHDDEIEVVQTLMSEFPGLFFNFVRAGEQSKEIEFAQLNTHDNITTISAMEDTLDLAAINKDGNNTMTKAFEAACKEHGESVTREAGSDTLEGMIQKMVDDSGNPDESTLIYLPYVQIPEGDTVENVIRHVQAAFVNADVVYEGETFPAIHQESFGDTLEEAITQMASTCEDPLEVKTVTIGADNIPEEVEIEDFVDALLSVFPNAVVTVGDNEYSMDDSTELTEAEEARIIEKMNDLHAAVYKHGFPPATTNIHSLVGHSHEYISELVVAIHRSYPTIKISLEGTELNLG